VGAALLAALKSLPALVTIIGQLGETIKQAQSDSIDNKYTKLRDRVDEITIRIESAKSDEDRRILVRDLNLAISE